MPYLEAVGPDLRAAAKVLQDTDTPGLHKRSGSRVGIEAANLGRAPVIAVEFAGPPGRPQPPRNWQRWSHRELDKIIEQIRRTGFDDPKALELGREYVKLAVREMPTIPLMSYNVFTTMDDTYWTGYPDAEAQPYTNPVPNWANTRYMMVRLKARQ